MRGKHPRFVFCFTVVVILFSSAFSMAAFAGPVVKHEKIVAADGSGDFTTITAALEAITDASDTNRYLITVRPGIYNEVVNMKQYVDLRGSGQENTVISAQVPGTAYPPSSATLVMANNSTVSNMTIKNTISGPNGQGTYPAAILFKEVAAKAANVTAEISVTSGASVYEADGISICAPMPTSAHATLTNVIAHAMVTGSGYASGVATWGEGGVSATITNSKMVGVGGNWASGFGGRTTDISNSLIEASNSDKVDAVYAWQPDVKVYNSVIHATNGTTWTRGVNYQARVGGSLIEGSIEPGAKIVNCWDQDFNPIPNQ